MVTYYSSGSHIGIVEKEISPDKIGRVRYQRSSWPARCKNAVTLTPDTEVRIVGRENITLLVDTFSWSETYSNNKGAYCA